MENSFKEIKYNRVEPKDGVTDRSYPENNDPSFCADEYRRDEIVYDEGFRAADTPVSDENEPVALDEKVEEKKPKKPLPLLISIQLVLCILIALSAFVLKTAASPVYDTFRSWYDSLMKRTLISQKAFESLDIEKLFSSASPSEAAPSEKPAVKEAGENPTSADKK